MKAISVKVYRALGFLKHAKESPTKSILKTLYTSIVEFYFRYFCSIWGSAGSIKMKLLQQLQNRAARPDTNSSYYAHTGQLKEEFDWGIIDEKITIEYEIKILKSLNGLAPQYQCDFILETQLSPLIASVTLKQF